MPTKKSDAAAPIHPHRGFAHTFSIIIAMTSAFFLGLVILSLMFLRGT